MKRLSGLLLAAALAFACGRYGPPQRAQKPEPASAPASATVPLTDPAVPR
jgi:hypothetical protein